LAVKEGTRQGLNLRDLGCYQWGRQAPGKHDMRVQASVVRVATQRTALLSGIKPPKCGTCPQNHHTPSTFPPTHFIPPSPRLREPSTTMTTSGISDFNIDDLFNYDYCTGNFGFDGSGYSVDPSQVAGPSQPYTGAEVSGNLHEYSDFPSPFTAPTSLYPVHQTYTNEGKLHGTSTNIVRRLIL